MHRMMLVIPIAVVTSTLIGCTSQVPDHTDAWISYKYSNTCDKSSAACITLLSDPSFAKNYYNGLGIADPDNYTFSNWLADQGFPPDGSTDAHAIYANLADLQIGRDMHCQQTGQKIACYVSNFGNLPLVWGWGGANGMTWTQLRNGSWPNITDAVEAPLGGSAPLARVAMVYDPTINGPNQVSFYAFGESFTFDAEGNPIPHLDSLLYNLSLDQEGLKSVPRMCMGCHGGTYDTNSNTATGASFLPFDVFAFRYPKEAGYSLDDQQEALRKLNALVIATNPAKPIQDLINGMYANSVTVAGSQATDGYVPTGWSSSPTTYTGVIRPYCRMCHLAQPVSFTSSSDIGDVPGNVVNEVCTKHSMPHSQVAYGLDGKKIGFWNDRVAQQDLGNFLKAAGQASCLPSD